MTSLVFPSLCPRPPFHGAAGLVRRLLGWAAAILSLTATGWAASPPVLNESEIKAAAFYNVIAFTKWPASAFQSPDDPLVVGIVGRGPVEALLTKIVGGESWRDRKIVVERYATPRDIKSCHVLFIARSEHGNWNEIRQRALNRPMLTVSDAKDFALNGGNVQLSIEQNHLRILVNLSTTRANDLQLSSNLLHLAKIIGPVPDPIKDPHSDRRALPIPGFQFCFAFLP